MSSSDHVILPGSHRGPSPGARVLGVADPDQWVEVTIKIRRKAPLPAVDDRPEVPLSRAELAADFGASPEDIAAAKAAFEPYGLEVLASDTATRSVRLGGPVHAMEQAFQVKLLQYSHDRGDYRGRVGSVQIPAALKGVVVGVFGLDDRPVVKPRRPHAAGKSASVRAALDQSPAHATSKRRAWFFPSELATIYHFPPGDGTGQTVGLLEFGGGFFADDLATFCKDANVSVPTVVPISVNGTPTDAKDGAEDEVMLDIEVLAGACPKATLAVYFSNFDEQGWVDAVSKAVHDQANAPTVLSISWGMAEDDASWSQGALDTISESLQEAALAGITVCVASGDDGSGDQESDGHAHVDFPASSPYVLGVGGTTLRLRNNQPVEVAWKDGDGKRADNGGSTGGGVSVHFHRPAWQTIKIPSANPGAIDGRVVPDVAANASANTGYYIAVDGQSGVSGGTSAATPLWAALVARINENLGGGKRVGFLSPLLYKAVPGGTATLGSVGCNDITSGNNYTAAVGGYSAKPGYDAATGWGSPNGAALLAGLKKII